MGIDLSTTHHTTPTQPPARSYEGWALDQALAVDDVVPGLLAVSCRWGPGRRQVAFFVFARFQVGRLVDVLVEHLDGALLERGVAVDAASDPRAIIGRALLAFRPRKVLRAALGGVLPPGLFSALVRFGPDPLDVPGAYADIVRLFQSVDAIDRARVRVLAQHRGPLTIGQIRALIATEPTLVHRAVLPHLRDPESARTFGDAVAYVRRCCSTATPEALRASLDAWPVDRDIKLWVRRWADRFDRPPGLDELARVLADRPGIKLLATGADLVAVERRLRKNLRNMVSEVIVGRHAYVLYEPVLPETHPLIAVLRFSDRGYILERIDRLDQYLGRDPGMADLREHLHAAGVIVKSRVPVGPRLHAATRAWLNIYPWGWDEVDEPDLADDDAGVGG